MRNVVLHRLLVSIPLLFVVSVLTFVLQSFVPGDPARALLGVNATAEQYDALRQQLHLNDPLLAQYWLYLQGVLRGDLGNSIFTNEAVTSSITQRLPVTLSLIIGATAVVSLIGLPLGVLSATKGTALRRIVDVTSLVGNALPNFWVALVLVAVFAVGLGLFPATGWVDFPESPELWLTHLVLPLAALALGGIALIAKVTRDRMLSILAMDYIRTLRATGVSETSIIWKHALRNAGSSVITVIGLVLVSFIPGTILIENVFVLPGLGTLTVTATNQHDIPVIQGMALAFTLIVILANLLVDVLYGVIDPKVRTSK